MSDTPRTDAAWYASEANAAPLLKCSLQLERELSSLRRKLAAAEGMAEATAEASHYLGGHTNSAACHLRKQLLRELTAWQEANKI